MTLAVAEQLRLEWSVGESTGKQRLIRRDELRSLVLIKVRGDNGQNVHEPQHPLGTTKQHAEVVKAALAASGPPGYRREPQGSLVAVVELRIRELLQAWPTMPATVVAERIAWQYSIRLLRGRVSELRPVYLPPDPASRTAYQPGEIAQCDFWFPDIEVPVGSGQVRTATRLPVLTVVWILPVGVRGAD